MERKMRRIERGRKCKYQRANLVPNRRGDIPVEDWEDAYRSRPDLVDHTPGFKTVFEIKSVFSASLGAGEVDGYIDILNRRHFGQTYRPGDWQPRSNPYVISALPGIIGLPPITIQARNIGHGVIAYTTDITPEVVAIFVEASVTIARLVTTSTATQSGRSQLQPAFAIALSTIGGFAI